MTEQRRRLSEWLREPALYETATTAAGDGWKSRLLNALPYRRPQVPTGSGFRLSEPLPLLLLVVLPILVITGLTLALQGAFELPGLAWLPRALALPSLPDWAASPDLGALWQASLRWHWTVWLALAAASTGLTFLSRGVPRLLPLDW